MEATKVTTQSTRSPITFIAHFPCWVNQNGRWVKGRTSANRPSRRASASGVSVRQSTDEAHHGVQLGSGTPLPSSHTHTHTRVRAPRERGKERERHTDSHTHPKTHTNTQHSFTHSQTHIRGHPLSSHSAICTYGLYA